MGMAAKGVPPGGGRGGAPRMEEPINARQNMLQSGHAIQKWVT